MIPLVANAHPFQVDLGIGFLCTLEGFSFVRGLPFPDNPAPGQPWAAGPETASISLLITFWQWVFRTLKFRMGVINNWVIYSNRHRDKDTMPDWGL